MTSNGDVILYLDNGGPPPTKLKLILNPFEFIVPYYIRPEEIDRFLQDENLIGKLSNRIEVLNGVGQRSVRFHISDPIALVLDASPTLPILKTFSERIFKSEKN